MRCKNCGKELTFSRYFAESLNPIRGSWHTCRSCNEKFFVKTHFWHFFLFGVAILKGYDTWEFYVRFVDVSRKKWLALCVINFLVCYIICLFEQIAIFYIKK